MMHASRVRAGVLVVAVLVAAVPCELSVAAPQPVPPLLEQVRTAWARRQETVKTLRVTWEGKKTTPKGVLTNTFFSRKKAGEPDLIIPPEDAVGDTSGEILLDDVKTRIRSREPLWDGTSSKFITTQTDSVFDGILYSYLMQRDLGFSQQVIKNGTRNQHGANIPVFVLIEAVRGLTANLMGRPLNEFTQARSVLIGSRPLVELLRPRDETRGEAKMWVDPAADFSIVRIEEFDHDGKLAFKTVITPSRIPSGVWLPEQWSCIMVKPNGKLFQQVEVAARSREVNIETSADDFQLHPPAGTRIIDQTGTVTRHSITRESGPDREILRSELPRTYEDLARTETGDLAPTSPARQWRWVLVTAGALIALGSLGSLIRWRRHRVHLMQRGAGTVSSQEQSLV